MLELLKSVNDSMHQTAINGYVVSKVQRLLEFWGVNLSKSLLLSTGFNWEILHKRQTNEDKIYALLLIMLSGELAADQQPSGIL